VTLKDVKHNFSKYGVTDSLIYIYKKTGIALRSLLPILALLISIAALIKQGLI